MDYPVTLTHDDDTVLVDFVDLPAHTFGADVKDALRHGQAALATILDAYIKDGRDIPAPSRGRIRVQVPALIEAKIRLYEAMRAGNITKAELGRKLDWHPPQVDRLLAMTHGSQLDQLEAAFGALGKRLTVGIENVPRARVGGVKESIDSTRRMRGPRPSRHGKPTRRRDRRR